MSLRVAVLDVSNGDDDSKRNFRRELDAEVRVFDANEGNLPSDHARYDAAVVTGSRSSVYDDEAWISELKSWVDDALDDDLPVLGVCFGMELLADVLGGELGARDEWEFGYHMIHRTADSLLFDGVDEWFVAFTAHHDEVAELPPDATRLAENNHSVQAFRRDTAFGVQFHPEFDLETARSVMEIWGMPDERERHVLEEVTAENYADATQAKRLFDNFLEYARHVRSRSRSAAEA